MGNKKGIRIEMKEILVDLRKYDLSRELKKDFVSVDELLDLLENKIYEIKNLEEKIEKLERPSEDCPDYE